MDGPGMFSGDTMVSGTGSAVSLPAEEGSLVRGLDFKLEAADRCISGVSVGSIVDASDLESERLI